MPSHVKFDRFIPIRKSDVIQACIQDNKLSEQDSMQFGHFCQLLVSTLHYEYHQLLEDLKDSYAPFDPNSDTLQLKSLDESTFLDVFDGVPQAAVPKEDIENGLDMIGALAAKTGFLS